MRGLWLDVFRGYDFIHVTILSWVPPFLDFMESSYMLAFDQLRMDEGGFSLKLDGLELEIESA